MMRTAIQKRWIKGFQIRNMMGAELEIYHLLYTDDTIIFCGPAIDQIRYIRLILLLLKLPRVVRVNWGKSSLFQVKEVPQIQELSNILGCRIEHLPTTYLGMSLGYQYKTLEIWGGIIKKTKEKLAKWKVQVDIIETPTPTFDSEQAKLKAQELRERARKRREVEEKKLEKKREKERIHAGKELLAAKRMRQENETRCFEAQRKTEKEEERRATERICQKLQQDMAERRAKLGSSLNSFTSSKSVKTSEQETKNPLEVESAALSGNLATKKEVLMECLRSLRRQHKEEDAKVQRAFKTLLVYVRNIVSNPDEGKFRKIRLSNPAFQ
ncbi:hypothetical protein BC332_23743, partial [Capsicum chinense]